MMLMYNMCTFMALDSNLLNSDYFFVCFMTFYCFNLSLHFFYVFILQMLMQNV